MYVFIESLRSGSVFAWLSLSVVAIIFIKLLFKFSNVFVLLGILIAIVYGFLALFPECTEFIANLLRTMSFDLTLTQ